ncbi:hypothetical protein NQ314_011772 [Rhamnusium bicolor]|uniref:Coiled-coil domain-containing protein 93 n=1 Tax=Rhamnusium bicolor TaxID=1586634 RepID=A0AAV8XG34_9CUCU|nr:hypothetical protein NQ314_011772 [Rhamnusium bicolor]
MSAFVRSYAVNQFNKQFDIKDKSAGIQKNILEILNAVSELYRPHRYYKRKNASPPDIQSRVQVTLLEYDHRGGEIHGSSSTGSTSEESVLEKQQTEERQIQQLLNNLTAAKEEIVDYDDLNEEEKKNLIKHYASLQSELKDGGLQSQEENQIAALEEQKHIFTERCSKLEDMKLSTEEELKENTSLLQEIRLKQQEADKALKELEQTEAKDPESVKEVEELLLRKHKETKQYYTLYNTLEDTRMYMQKELSLLNSISDSYPEAMQSSSSKEEFLEQFQNILDSLSHTLQGLVEQQRKYVAAVSQLSMECKKHETLLAQSQSKS